MRALSIPLVASPLAQPKCEVSVEAQDDNALVAMARTGQTEAFKELVDRYRKRCYWVAKKLVGNHETARDIAQEAFIRVYRSLDRFDPQYRFYTWLYQIVTNLCIDHLRKDGRARKVSLDEVGEPQGSNRYNPYRATATNELKRQVEEIIATLPPTYRTVIVLRDIEGMSAKEIAEIVDSTHSTVRWRLHKARHMFRENWEKRFPEDGGMPHEV